MSIQNDNDEGHGPENGTTTTMMMRTLKLEDIQALAHGESIPRFTGKIRKVWDQKSGEGEYGAWFLQNLIVAMEGGDEIQVTWTGEDAFDDSWEGKTVAFTCGENKQGKPVGVMRDVRTGKDGKVYKGVKVTPAGTVHVLDHGSVTINAPKAGRAEAPPAQSTEEKIAAAAEQAGDVFSAAWDAAGSAMSVILFAKENEEGLTVAEKLDLQLRIAQGFAIEINKVLRKERF